MTGIPPRGPAVPESVSAAREQVVELLSQQYAHDAITVEELDRRLALAYQAESVAELTALVADLQGGRRAIAVRGSAVKRAGAESLRGRRLLALFSSTRKRGLWRVPEQMDVVSVFAELELDLRDAVLSSAETVIEVHAAFCTVRVVVPPGVRVVNNISAVLAEVKDRSEDSPDPDAPVIVLEGWAGFAEVVIRTG